MVYSHFFDEQNVIYPDFKTKLEMKGTKVDLDMFQNLFYQNQNSN